MSTLYDRRGARIVSIRSPHVHGAILACCYNGAGVGCVGGSRYLSLGAAVF